jgi:hypothetical protein
MLLARAIRVEVTRARMNMLLRKFSLDKPEGGPSFIVTTMTSLIASHST